MRIRSKRLLITLAAIVAIVVAGYAAAPWIVATIASRSLSGTFEVQDLNIESVGLSRLEAGSVRINNNRLRVDVRGSVLRYDLWPFRIQGVELGRVEVTLPGLPPPAATETAQRAPIPAPPPFPVRVDDLRVEAETAWGPVALAASLSSRPFSEGGFEVAVRAPGLNAVLSRRGDDRYELEITDGGESTMLNLRAEHQSGYPISFSGRIEPARIDHWLEARDMLPPDLKPLLAPFAISSDGLDLDGRLEENLDFTARLRGGMTVRDARAAPGQLFEVAELRAPSGFELSRSGQAWSGSGEGAFRFAPNATSTLTGSNPGFRWDEDGLELRASGPALEPIGLAADSLSLTAPDPSREVFKGRLAASGVRIAGWPQALSRYDVSGEWSLGEAESTARGSASGAGLPQLQWTLETSGDGGRVEITSLEQPVAPLAPSIRTYTQALARDTTIKSGELNARYRLEWQGGRLNTDLAVDLGPLDAVLDETALHGLKLKLGNRDGDLQKLRLDVSAPKLELAAGAVAEDLKLEARLSFPKIHVDTARARLLGGNISLRPVTIDTASNELELFADLTNLSLERIMELLELESTQLTGQVSGPVRMVYNQRGGLEINEGKLHSVEPGVLRLTMTESSGAAAQLDNIALRALRNFHYDKLNASVLYKPDGEYRITARILGNNPKVLDGHPIALNPTIEGRLPALFRAFFVTGDFSRAIIERLQEERALSPSG